MRLHEARHFHIASHMSELGEEILSYHRDEDYKIVRLRDDLISAVRYAFMMRRSGKLLEAAKRTAARPASTGTMIRVRRGVIGAATPNWRAAWISTFSGLSFVGTQITLFYSVFSSTRRDS